MVVQVVVYAMGQVMTLIQQAIFVLPHFRGHSIESYEI